MTADLPTYPSTEAVGEVRRRGGLRVGKVEIVGTFPSGANCHEIELLVGVAIVGSAQVTDSGRMHLEAALDGREVEHQLREHGRTIGELQDTTERMHCAETERDQARADLSAMTSDRDWLREELGKAAAEIAELRERLAAYQFALEAEQSTAHAVAEEAKKLAVAKWVRRPSTDTVELNPED